MDSLDTPPPPLSAPSNMAIGGQTAYSPANNNASSTIALNQPSAQMIPPSSRFPFNHPVIPPSSVPLDSLNVSPYDGSHSANFNVDSGKKRRGRPRKYAPDANNIALGLAPTPTVGSSVPHGDLSATPDSEQPARKTRGRPPGFGWNWFYSSCLIGKAWRVMQQSLAPVKLHLEYMVGMPTTLKDVAAKILSFSQQGPRTVFILSANGTLSNATLRHSASSGGSVSYEGHYDIISLSGSFLLSENNGTRSRTGGLSVLLAGSNGQVLGGGVAGMLMASSQVQVIVGSFLEDDKKSNTSMLNSGTSSAPSQMINFGGGGGGGLAAAAASPPSLGGSSGESSGENGDSPLNNRHPGMFNNSSQPIHNIQMYQLWAGQTQQ
ncbi:AT-hook motif nuclear-localized protein 13-like [Cucumis melo var. makuwa]|uniref:AT-hook motif nuclear-localized protein n=1 Tax=Cucumis melo var. makuwa TaxID=1194695 RepID=A0A5A7T539_CUCMM|nr:AT-hook motif nuclear-localized protein 13-like [Cucumis melo var. makuwa]